MFEEPYIADTITGALLAGAGVTGLRAWRSHPSPLAGLFWLFAGAGFVALALDEWTSFHEHYAERYLPEIGWLNHSDDIIILGYATTAAVAVALWLREILADRTTAHWLLVALIATAAAALVDGFAPNHFWLMAWVEEGAEMTAATAALLATRARLASLATPRVPGSRPGQRAQPGAPYSSAR